MVGKWATLFRTTPAVVQQMSFQNVPLSLSQKGEGRVRVFLVAAPLAPHAPLGLHVFP